MNTEIRRAGTWYEIPVAHIVCDQEVIEINRDQPMFCWHDPVIGSECYCMIGAESAVYIWASKYEAVDALNMMRDISELYKEISVSETTLGALLDNYSIFRTIVKDPAEVVNTG